MSPMSSKYDARVTPQNSHKNYTQIGEKNSKKIMNAIKKIYTKIEIKSILLKPVWLRLWHKDTDNTRLNERENE